MLPSIADIKTRIQTKAPVKAPVASSTSPAFRVVDFKYGGSYNVGSNPDEIIRSPRGYGGTATVRGSQRDHIFPVSLGGTSKANNIQILENKRAEYRDNVEKYVAREAKAGRIKLNAARVMVLNWENTDIPGQKAFNKTFGQNQNLASNTLKEIPKTLGKAGSTLGALGQGVARGLRHPTEALKQAKEGFIEGTAGSVSALQIATSRALKGYFGGIAKVTKTDSRLTDTLADKLAKKADENRALQDVIDQSQMPDKRVLKEKLRDPKFVFKTLLGRNAPNLLLGIGAGAVGSIAGGPVGLTTATFGFSSALEGGYARNQAKSFLEKSPDPAAQMLAKDDSFLDNVMVATGIVNGALESIPEINIINRTVFGLTAKKLVISHIAKLLAIQPILEGSTEYVQQLVGNVVAQTYNPEQPLTEGGAESFIAGLLLGGTTGVSATAGLVGQEVVRGAREAFQQENLQAGFAKLPEFEEEDGGTFYHATSKENVPNINEKGFEARTGETSEGLTEGKGVWLFPDRKMADKFSESFIGEEGAVVPAKVTGKIFKLPSDIADNVQRLAGDTAFIEGLRKDGFVGFEGVELGGNRSVFIFDTKAVSTKVTQADTPTTVEEFNALPEEKQEALFPSLPAKLQLDVLGIKESNPIDQRITKIASGKEKMRISGGIKREYIRNLGKGAYMRIFRNNPNLSAPDEIADEMGITENELIERLATAVNEPKVVESKSVKKSEQFAGLSKELKARIRTFFRPSRAQNSRAFALLGNKDTTVPLFDHIFTQWVESGVTTIVEPYAGAFTLGTHSISDAIKAGLKAFHSNIFDREKFIIVKAIQDGKLEEVQDLVRVSVGKLSDSIRKYGTSDEVKPILDEFFRQFPNSYVGSSEFHSFVTERPVGAQVTVYGDIRTEWAQTFQKAYNELFKEGFKGDSLEGAVMNEVIKRTGVFGGNGQSLIGVNGFRPFEARLFGKYGTVKAFEDIAAVFKLAEESGTEITLYNMDGAKMIEKVRDGLDPKTTGYYLDPPYVKSAETYTNVAELQNFASGISFVNSHIGAFEDSAQGARIALTNDVHGEYIETVSKNVKDAQIFAYKEGVTPTSLIVSGETAPLIETFLTQAGKLVGGERAEVARIKELQKEMELSNLTVSAIKKFYEVKNIKSASDEQLADVIQFMESMEEGDKFITPLQISSLKDLLDINLFNRPKLELVTQREFTEAYGELTEINNGRITKYIADEMFPSVDVKENNPLVSRTIEKADEFLAIAETNKQARAKELDALFTAAEKERAALLPTGERVKRKILPRHTEVFQVLSGMKVTLTKGETALVMYLKDFFLKARNELKLEKYRSNYITHMEKPWMEKILQYGVWNGLKAIVNKVRFKTLEETLPVSLLLELDNIIGSEKFFKFTLERNDVVDPSFNLRRVVNDYSAMFEEKMALDKILPEGQAIVQLLLKPRTAKWQKRFLQNLKGRGADWSFRMGKFGWLAKVADAIIGIGYYKLLGLNVMSGIKNWVAGTANSFIGQDFDKFVQGKLRFTTNPKKSIQLAQKYHIMDGAFYEYITTGLLGKATKLRDTVFIFQKAGEWEIRGSLFVGELTEEEWGSGEISPKRVREIKDLVAITQGVFTKVDSPLWVQTWYGRLFMQMNRWRITNLNLIRRHGPKAVAEIRAGNYRGKSSMVMLKALVLYGLGMWIGWELEKAGYKRASKIARSMAESFNTIVTLLTTDAIIKMFTDNPTFSVTKEMFFSMQQLAHYLHVPGVDAPRTIEYNQGIQDTYIALKSALTPKELTAEEWHKKLSKLSSEEAGRQYAELVEKDPKLAKSVHRIAEDEKRGITVAERKLLNLGVADGKRAQAVADELNSIESVEERRRKWNEWVKEKIITEAVAEQVKKLLEQ